MNKPNQHLIDIEIAKMRGASVTSDSARKLLEQVRKERLMKFERAKSTAPRFLPVLQDKQLFACQGTGVVGEIFERYTVPRNYQMLLTGMISNAVMTGVQIQAVMSEETWMNDFINIDQVAGVLNSGGPDYFYQPVPQLLGNKEQMLVKFLNGTGNSQKQYFVFQGLKIFPLVNTDQSPFDSSDQIALDEIKNNIPQRTVYLDLVADFTGTSDGDSVPNVQSNQYAFPLIVYGAATNGIFCLVELKDASDDDMTAGPCPINAVAQDIVVTSNNHKAEPYLWFPKPFYLPANAQFTANFINGLNGATESGLVQMSFICSTP